MLLVVGGRLLELELVLGLPAVGALRVLGGPPDNPLGEPEPQLRPLLLVLLHQEGVLFDLFLGEKYPAAVPASGLEEVVDELGEAWMDHGAG